jgi:hypothetical protein
LVEFRCAEAFCIQAPQAAARSAGADVQRSGLLAGLEFDTGTLCDFDSHGAAFSGAPSAASL